MNNLNFLQEDESFLALLDKQHMNAGEYSILPQLDEILEKYNINLKSSFFLESYLKLNKNCEFLNVHFLELFHKAIYLNEREGLLLDLLLNNYDKKKLCQIVFNEFDANYDDYSIGEVEGYKWSLCDILYSIGLKQYEEKYIELLMDSTLGASREMLIQLLKKIKCKQRMAIFEELKRNDSYFKDYKFF